MNLPPPPSSRDLLPPLLACLPTSFVSPRPPPALLPLLSPLLRQRLTYLTGSSSADGWLRLLSWDVHRASKLPAVVERMDLEPHPVSGELELSDTRPAKYRRLDQDTLHARLEVDQFGLLATFVWCAKDEHGGTEPGWKLSELCTLDDIEDGTQWFESPAEASDAMKATSLSFPQTVPTSTRLSEQEEDDGNDDYWASYDRTPAQRTPAKQSPAPYSSSVSRTNTRTQEHDETDYYARYGEEVQPAMDNHDPDEDTGDFGDSTLKGGSVLQPQESQNESNNQVAAHADYLRSLQPHTEWKPHDSAVHTAMEQSVNGEHPERELSMPRPISPAASNSSVDRLEERAAEMSTGSDPDRAQLAIQQHISTDVKSLFRLAKASGMCREEFTRIVQTELEVLSMLENDE